MYIFWKGARYFRTPNAYKSALFYLGKKMRNGADEILILEGAWPTAAATATALVVIPIDVVGVIIQISRALHQDDIVRPACNGVEASWSTRKKVN